MSRQQNRKKQKKMKTPSSLGCHLDTIVAPTASPRVACFAQMPSFLLPIFMCLCIYMCVRCGCRVLKRKVKRGIFFVCVSSIPPSAGQKEREQVRKKKKAENSKERQKRNRKTSSKIFLFKKKTRSFLSPHTRPGLFACARGRES